MKITFTRDEIYETEGLNKGPKFLEGKTYDLRDDQAQRWINRKAAVPAKDNAKAEDLPVYPPVADAKPAKADERAEAKADAKADEKGDKKSADADEKSSAVNVATTDNTHIGRRK